MVIDPESVNDENSGTYRMNHIFSLFDRTDAGSYIPLGFNRLALLLVAQHFLVEETDRRQVQTSELIRRLEDLGKP